MTTDSSSAGMPLRQLRWPSLPAVDLLEECHWLVTLGDKSPNRARNPRSSKDEVRHKLDLLNEMPTKELQNLSKQKSPYGQPLRRPKPPAPSPGSPAQRAAKSILKIKEGLLHVDKTKWPSDIQDHVALPPQQIRQQLINGLSEFEDSSVTIPRLTSPSPKRTTTPTRSPNRKVKKRPPTREERELAEKQKRLALWLNANPDTNHPNAVQDGGVLNDTSSPYSIEVESRIESTMQCGAPLESGVRLWDDPVRSLLAAEMTSESVFGGATSTRALAFQIPRVSQTIAASPMQPLLANGEEQNGLLSNCLGTEQLVAEENTNTLDSASLEVQLSGHAQKVFDTAHRQVADGAVADALATLEVGIRQSLSASQAHLDAANGSRGAGFNYSVLAHKSATKLQLYYRARHRRRINRLMLLQRQWRWWHARRRMLSSVHFANKQALVIQRRYRLWHTHITQVRSVVRIQRCFRVFKTQKFLCRFRQVCRLLMARQARCRQVKTRIRVISKMILLFRRRRRRIVLIQGLWRRHCARTQLATLLAHMGSIEVGRRAREDEFVAARLAQARLHFREFLKNTKRGRELVRWQIEKPWLRFRRLRHGTEAWDELPLFEKIEVVARILPDREFRGFQAQALCQMLIGKNKQLLPLPNALKVSTEELGFHVNSSTASSDPKFHEPVGCWSWIGAREKVKNTRTKLSRRTAILWWALVIYPLEYCAARICPIRKHRRDQARQQLEDDFARVLISFLRVWFRRVDSKTNTPPYACEWCSEPFSSSRDFFAHDKCTGARAEAEAEWTALNCDLEFVRRKKWCFSKPPLYEHPVRADKFAFDLEAASVRRLRHSRSSRKALRSLVATLEACTGDSPNAVIPLDLAAFVLQYLDDGTSSHPLLQTVEHQLVRWKTLIGSMEVETSMQTPEGSGFQSRWIRKNDLRSRLIGGNEWTNVFSRWRRSLVRRASKYQQLVPCTGSCNQLTTRWKELQLRMRRLVSGRGAKTAQDIRMPPSAAGNT